MTDLFKSAAQAGYEARSRGQTGIAPPEDPTLQRLGEMAYEGSNAIKPVATEKTAIAPAAPSKPVSLEDKLNAITQDYRNSYESDPEWQQSQRPAPQEVGFTDSVAKGFKGLMVTWDFLANKLEHAVTGNGADTDAILAKGVEEYKAKASDPRIAEMVKRGNEADGWMEAGKSMLGYAIDNPGMIVNFIGEQVPAVIASLPVGGLGGGVANAAVSRTALSAGTQAAITTASAGASINASAVVLQSLGTNYVEGLDKFNGDKERAKDYATTKTLNEVPANAVAGAFLGFNPFTRFAGRAPVASATGNVLAQSTIQGTGGAAGAYQAAKSVGEDVGYGDLLAEFGGEFLTGPVDLATASHSGAKPKATSTSDFSNVPNIEITGVGVNPDAPAQAAPAKPSFNITDKEFGAAVNSPAFMAGLYSRADADGQQALQNANPNLNLAGLSQDPNLVMDGLKIVDANPNFTSAFTERVNTQPAQAQVDHQNNISNPPPNKIPVREQMRMAQEAAQEGMMQAEQSIKDKAKADLIDQIAAKVAENLSQKPQQSAPATETPAPEAAPVAPVASQDTAEPRRPAPTPARPLSRLAQAETRIASESQARRIQFQDLANEKVANKVQEVKASDTASKAPEQKVAPATVEANIPSTTSESGTGEIRQPEVSQAQPVIEPTIEQGQFVDQAKPKAEDVVAQEQRDAEVAVRRKEAISENIDTAPYSDAIASARIENKFGKEYSISPRVTREFTKGGKVVGKMFQGKGFDSYLAFNENGLDGSNDYTISSGKPASIIAAMVKKQAVPRKPLEGQGKLELSRKPTKEESAARRAESKIGTSEELVKQDNSPVMQEWRRQEARDAEKQAKMNKAIREAAANREPGMFDDDTGGVMGNLARSGAMGSDAVAELGIKEKRTAARQAQENAAIDAHAERMNRRAEATAQTVDNEEIKALAETQRQGDVVNPSAKEEFESVDDVVHAEQMALGLETEQQYAAVQLADSVSKGEMSLEQAKRKAREDGVGQYNLVNAMRQFGIDPDINEVSETGFLAANYTLRSYVRDSGLSPFRARESWLRSYDNMKHKEAVELTKTEQAAYDNWKARREKYITRITEQAKENAPYMAGNLDDVFPNVLFTQFSLDEMRNPAKIDEPLRSMIHDLYADPVRTWFNDIRDVLVARPDFEEQVYNSLTAEEAKAYDDWSTLELRAAFRDSEMLTKSPAYSQLDQLRYLSPELYMDYKTQIRLAEQNQLGVILHEAAEMNDRAKAAIEAGANPENTIDAQMREYMLRDEQQSQTMDEFRDDDFGDGTALYKRGNFSGAVSALAIQEHLTTKFAKWDNQPAYTVVQNANQLPMDVKSRLTSRFNNGSFKGALDPKTGHIYLFSDFMENVADAEFVMFHELYGHWGMRAFLGSKMDTFLENQYKLNQQVREAADRIRSESADSGMPMGRIESIEEAISDIAAKGDSSLFREIVGRLAAWLKSHGFDTVAKWMDQSGESELAYILGAAKRAARNQGLTPMDGAPSNVKYAANKIPVELFATRDGKTTGYARVNPIDGTWTVFQLQADGDFQATSMEDYAQALASLKRSGTAIRIKDRPTRIDIDPSDFRNIPNPNDIKGWRKLGRQFLIKAQNQYIPIYEVAEHLKSQGKDNQVVESLKLYEGRTKYFVDGYEQKYQRPIEKLLSKINDLGGTLDDIDLYLLARHAKERNTVIKSINPKNEYGSGMGPKARKLANGDVVPGYIDVLRDAETAKWSKEIKQLGKLMDSMSQDKAQYMLAHGLISQHTYDSISRYEHYVTLSGNDTDMEKVDVSVLGGRAMNLRGADAARALGRGTLPVDILQNTMNGFLSTIIRGQKAVVVRSVLDMVEANPDPNFASVEEIKTVKRLNTDRLLADKNILKWIGDAPTEKAGKQFLESIAFQVTDGSLDVDGAISAIRERIREAEARRDIEPAEADAAIRRINEDVAITGRMSPDGYVTEVEANNDSNAQNVLIAKVDGKPVKITFKEKGAEFINALSGMHMQSNSSTLNAIGAWGRFFSQLVTSWNPAWVAVNGIRDFQTVLSNMATDPKVGVKLADEMRKEWYQSLQTAFRFQRADHATKHQGWWGEYLSSRSEKHPASAEELKWYDEFRKSGAETFFLDRKSLEETIDSLNRKMNGPNGVLEFTKDKIDGVADLMELLTMPMETAPRFAVYKVLRKNGWSIEDAAIYAKEVSVNFNQKGSSAWLRNLYVFANPSIQGTFRLFKDYSRGEKGISKLLPSNRFAATMGSWMLLGIIGNFLARAIGGSDDDLPGVDKLDKIPHHKRSTSFILAPDIPGMSLPIGYGINFFYTLGHYLPDVWSGRITEGQYATKMLKTAFDAFSPVGSGADSQSVAGAAAKTIAPSISVPLVELAMNENRFGAPIYKGSNPFSDVDQANAYMHFNSANPISVSLARSVNEATGGTRYKHGVIDMNPAVIDYFISSYLPGLVNEVYKSAGATVNKAKGLDVQDGPLPLVGRLTAKVPEGWDAGALRRAKQAVDTQYKELTASDTPRDRKTEILKEHPKLAAAKAIVSGADESLKRLNMALEQFERDPRKSDEQKANYRNNIESQKRKIQNRAVKAALDSGFRNELIND